MSFVSRKLVSTLFYLFLTISSAITYANNARVLVSNISQEAVQIKWYSNSLIYPEGVNIYRNSEGTEEWIKLNATPIIKEDKTDLSDFKNDSTAFALAEMVNVTPKEKLEGFLLLNVLVKSFQSTDLCDFLGISYVDSDVQVDQEYRYKITALVGTTEESLAISDYIKATTPQKINPPDSITVRTEKEKVNISWKPNDGLFYAVDVYRRSKGEKTFKKVNNNPLMVSKFPKQDGSMGYPDVFYQDSDVEPKQVYDYQIIGLDYFGGKSEPSKIFTITVEDYNPPPKPRVKEASVTNLSIDLSWEIEEDSDIEKFQIIGSTSSIGKYTKFNKEVIGREKRNYQLQVDKPAGYYFKLVAVDSSGNKTSSNPRYVEVADIIPPKKPSDIYIKKDTGRLTLLWDHNSEPDLKGYYVYRAAGSNSSDFVLLNARPLNSSSFIDLHPKRTRNRMRYKVVAVDTNYNYSEASNIATVDMIDMISPEKPVIKRVLQNDKAVEIEWVQNVETDLMQYWCIKSVKEEGIFVRLEEIKISAEEKSFIDLKIVPDAVYQYVLIAEDGSANRSLPSTPFEIEIVATEQVLLELDNVKAKYKRQSKTVVINWEEPKNQILGVKVFKKSRDQEVFYPISDLLQSEDYFVDKTVSGPEDTLTYEVRAYSDQGDIYRSQLLEVKVK